MYANANSGKDHVFTLDPKIIEHLIGIDYNKLSAERMNRKNSLMPFESYSGRTVPTLSCYGSLPKYSNATGWSRRRISEGDPLTVPDSMLFRNYFNGR